MGVGHWGCRGILLGLLALGCGGEAVGPAQPELERPPQEAPAPGPTPEGPAPTSPAPAAPPPLSPCLALPGAGETPLPEAELAARQAYACAGIALEGEVRSAAGAAGVAVQGARVRTDAAGRFAFAALPRANALLEVQAEGFRPALLALELRRSLSETRVQLAPLYLSPREEGSVRMLFGGDVALGRRFLDVNGFTARDRMPRDTPGALIQVSDPEPGTRAVFEHVRPYFQAADFRAINLESPVTDAPRTPNRKKPFVFFTLPGSLPALRWAGVDYVGLGNNHVYDYYEPGIADTLRHLDAAGLAHSGAGLSPDAAFVPHRQALGGATYSFLSACAIDDDPWLSGTADEGRGGAADLNDGRRLSATLRGEAAAGRVPVALLHTGVEYGAEPQRWAAELMRSAVRAGAALVIAHHPHVPQGFAREDGVLVAQSLGNLAFDQDRLETLMGVLAEVELQGAQVRRARALPVYLEDYRPRPATGALADGLLRELAESSREGGVELVPQPGAGELLAPGVQARVSERGAELEVEVGPRGWAVVDLRGLRREGESLAAARLEPLAGDGGAAVAGARLRAGRDILLHGDFEDHDVDTRLGETPRWRLSPGAYACQREVHAGAAALCLEGGARADLDGRLRVPGHGERKPNKALTLVGWARGEGELRLVTHFMASASLERFGEAEPLRQVLGAGWAPLAADVPFPEDPRGWADAFNAPWAMELTLRHVGKAGALGAVDDLAVVAWERTGERGTLSLQTPHPRDFVRVEAPAGRYRLAFTLREHRVP
jgi:poly-gamma-glutamate capsule biosynthesis protein CapA/YwtB (metallophosphatase superfamily)